MKQRWPFFLLLLSLAVNAGVLGSYGVRKYRERRQLHWYWSKMFKPGTTLRQFDRLDADRTRSEAPYRDTLDAATREIGRLALGPSPDSARVNAALDRIARAKREGRRSWYVWMQGFFELYRPEKLELWRNKFKVEYDSTLQADSATAFQPKEER